MKPGKHTLNWLKNEQLRIDPEWMIDTPKGLTWWPDAFACLLSPRFRCTFNLPP